ncbi:MAG: hypothetical protein IJM68_00845 [Synergistaceae bacterium]|nr:hypothetical protein [Synergistaceae bacterium]
MRVFSIEQAVKECRKYLVSYDIPDEQLAQLIAQAPQMYGLIRVLLHENVLQDTLNGGYPALSRARNIVESVTGQKRVWPDEESETTNRKDDTP